MDTAFRIVQIVLALAGVIFVHELGHFLMARWCGVRVERFSIGFGPVLLAWKGRATEYALSLVPLGGYVKMYGHAEMPGYEHTGNDPESFQNKTVGQRMAIISAGVVMNVLLAFVCFTLAYRSGVDYPKATVGAAVPGKPAWNAGLRMGDEPLTINGHADPDFTTLTAEVALSDPSRDVIDLTVRRGGPDGRVFGVALHPVQEALKPIVGVRPSSSLTTPPAPNPAVQPDSPAGSLPDMNDRTIAAAEGVPLDGYYDFVRTSYRHRGQPLELTLVPIPREDDGPRRGPQTVTVAANPMRTLGLRLRMKPVVAVADGSPAANATDAAGEPDPVRPDDLIVAVDGEPVDDPMRFPDRITARAGRKVALTLARPKAGGLQDTVTVYVVPEDVPTWIDYVYSLGNPLFGVNDLAEPVAVPSLGVAYGVLPQVAAVADGSPAATADTPLRPGDVLTAATLAVAVPDSDATSLAVDLAEAHQWTGVFLTMQSEAVTAVTLSVRRGDETFDVTLVPAESADWFNWHRGFNLLTDFGVRKVDGLRDSISLGVEKTRRTLIQLYLVLRGFFVGTLSVQDNIAGPITIARIAYDSSAEFSQLMEILALISINLAVVNFLPIPILDGGHMVFLLYEAVFRRRPSERVLVAANFAGLLVVLALMCTAIYVDVSRVMAE